MMNDAYKEVTIYALNKLDTPLLECKLCGALVLNVFKHDQWHAEAKSRPDEEEVEEAIELIKRLLDDLDARLRTIEQRVDEAEDEAE